MSLSTIGIWVGLGLSVIGLFDLFLSPTQMKAIDTLGTKLWNEADDIRKLSFADRLAHPAVNNIALGLVALGLAGLVAVIFRW
jgi:hypothetical protein